MDCIRYSRIALSAALLAAALTLPAAVHAEGSDGRNDARGPLELSAEAAAGPGYSQGRNATPRRSVVAPYGALAQACSETSGRNTARTGLDLSCTDLDADGAPET